MIVNGSSVTDTLCISDDKTFEKCKAASIKDPYEFFLVDNFTAGARYENALPKMNSDGYVGLSPGLTNSGYMSLGQYLKQLQLIK